MSSFTSAAAPEQYNDDQAQFVEPAYEDTSGESCRDDHSATQRVLREAIERQRVGLEGSQAARFQLLKLFARIERFGEQVDEAFGGQLFLQNMPPDAPANRRRANAYLEQFRQYVELLGQALDLWMITCGMKREDDWVPLVIEEMRQRAQQKGCENERR